MNVIHESNQFAAENRKVCVALGMFDGVHLGHQRVLRQTVQDARQHEGVSVAITFDQHPNAVVAPERTPPLIYRLSQRLRAIDSLGIETVLLIHFDRAFSQQSGEVFVTGLARDFGRLQSIAVGSNFSFGHKRTGNVTLLKALGQKLGFVVHDLPAVSCRGNIISSTRIRESVQAGNFALAGEMLGRAYSIAGRVVRGEQLGQKIGFPTANLDVTGLALPPSGVYAGHLRIDQHTHAGVANLGFRPTLNRPDAQLRVEVHLLDFSGDLYDQEVEFQFVQRLRGEEKFASLDALGAQIQKDLTAAKALLS